ncbi:uncharacterized protein ACB058_006544 isoform 1-T2 [Synchiropus picturatus]
MTAACEPQLTKAESLTDVGSFWLSEMPLSVENIVGLVSQVVILSFIFFLIFIYVFSMLSCCCSMCCETPPMSLNRCSWPVENLRATYIINSDVTIAEAQQQEEPHREPPPSYDELDYSSETASEDMYPDRPPPYADPNAPHNAPRDASSDAPHSAPKTEEEAGMGVMREAGQGKVSGKTNYKGRNVPEESGEASMATWETPRDVDSLRNEAQRQSQTNLQRKVTQV